MSARSLRNIHPGVDFPGTPTGAHRTHLKACHTARENLLTDQVVGAVSDPWDRYGVVQNSVRPDLLSLVQHHQAVMDLTLAHEVLSSHADPLGSEDPGDTNLCRF